MRGSNSEGADDIVINFTVGPQAPVLPDGPLSYTVIEDAEVGPITISNTGGDIEDNGCQFLNEQFEIIDASTLTLSLASAADACTLSGSLGDVGMHSFIIGARNATDADSVTVEFTVNPAGARCR